MRLRCIFAAVALALAGCGGRTVYVEGTEFSLGAYLPMDGQLYGIQILRYRNGVASVSTNSNMHVERTFAATNSYLGVVHTAESSQTKAETK